MPAIDASRDFASCHAEDYFITPDITIMFLRHYFTMPTGRR